MNISIITAGFSSEYLNDVWNSIKDQTHKNWEWILVIDDSAEVREWYTARKEKGWFEGYDVWSIDVDKNRGRYGLVSRNIGVMASSYDRIVFLDDDNKFQENDLLETLVKTEEETGKLPYTKLHIIGKKPGSTVDRYKNTHPSRNHIDLSNLFYRKDLFIKAGLFNDNLRRICFDADLIEAMVKIIGEENFIKVDRHIYFRHKRY